MAGIVGKYMLYLNGELENDRCVFRILFALGKLNFPKGYSLCGVGDIVKTFHIA